MANAAVVGLEGQFEGRFIGHDDLSHVHREQLEVLQQA
jgi:hypothetical protein